MIEDTVTELAPTKGSILKVILGHPAIRPLGTLPLREGGGAKHSPPSDARDKIW